MTTKEHLSILQKILYSTGQHAPKDLPTGLLQPIVVLSVTVKDFFVSSADCKCFELSKLHV